jgi:hypothetical protein
MSISALVSRLPVSLVTCGLLTAWNLSTPAWADFVVPSSGDPRFGWEVGDPNTTHVEWDVFTVPYLGPNFPDVAGGPPSSLTQIGTDTAFPTTGGNIYSPSGVVAFTTNIDTSMLFGVSTQVIAQIGTIGTELDYGSILLNNQTPDYTEELFREPFPGFGGFVVDYLASWDLDSPQPSYTLDFAASGSSTSLAALRVDAFAAIPEPTSFAALFGSTMCLLVRRRSRRR